MNKIIKKERIPKITLEDLALMVKKGFDSVDKRFDDVYKRFDEIDKRFDDMDKRFDRLEAKFDNLENTVYKDHGPRIRHIEKKLII